MNIFKTQDFDDKSELRAFTLGAIKETITGNYRLSDEERIESLQETIEHYEQKKQEMMKQ